MTNIVQSLGALYPRFLAPRLSGSGLRGFLRLLSPERELERLRADHREPRGLAFVERALEHFGLGYQVPSSERENIPAEGRVLILANRPTGVLEALALIHLVGSVRPDLRVAAVGPLDGLEPLSPLLLPGEGVARKGRSQTLEEALEAERAVILFPARSVSRWRPEGVRDGRWDGVFLRVARRCDAPLVPVFLRLRQSARLQGAPLAVKPIEALLLAGEHLFRRSPAVALRVGEVIPPARLARPGISRRSLARMVRRHLYRVGAGRGGVFATERAVAHPLPRQQIKAELRQARLLGATGDGKQIYLFDYAPDSAVMKEIGRLRELSFRKVGEGTGQRRDLDRFDRDYRHLVLWDNEELEIVGAYRIGETADILARAGLDGLYTHTLFDLDAALDGGCLGRALELGRSFVQPAYWGSRALDYLWQGIGAYLRAHPHVRYLYGPVSISDAYPRAARDALVHFYGTHFARPDSGVPPRLPYAPDEGARAELLRLMPGRDAREDFRTLRQYLQQFGLSVPTLYKQYTEVCEPAGVRFLGFNLDPDFANCVDGLVCVDLDRLKPSKRQRYLHDRGA